MTHYTRTDTIDLATLEMDVRRMRAEMIRTTVQGIGRWLRARRGQRLVLKHA